MSALRDTTTDADTDPCPVREGDRIIWGSGARAREYEITDINECERGDAEVRLMPEEKRPGVPKSAIWMPRADIRSRLRGESSFRRLG